MLASRVLHGTSTCSSTRASTCVTTHASTCILHVLARVIIHVHDYYLKTCGQESWSLQILFLVFKHSQNTLAVLILSEDSLNPIDGRPGWPLGPHCASLISSIFLMKTHWWNPGWSFKRNKIRTLFFRFISFLSGQSFQGQIASNIKNKSVVPLIKQWNIWAEGIMCFS